MVVLLQPLNLLRCTEEQHQTHTRTHTHTLGHEHTAHGTRTKRITSRPPLQYLKSAGSSSPWSGSSAVRPAPQTLTAFSRHRNNENYEHAPQIPQHLQSAGSCSPWRGSSAVHPAPHTPPASSASTGEQTRGCSACGAGA